MKRPVLLFAASAAAACCLLASCGSRSPEQPEPASGSAAPEGAQTAADSERAMDNFLAKVGAGNYVMRAENYLTTSVYSPDQVLFTYADEAYDDYAVMSVDQEAFEALVTDGALGEAEYAGEGRAVDAVKERLLHYWLDEEVSQGNIWNLFYNVQEEPLKFVSHDETVKESLLRFAGYGDSALRLMQDVCLVLDQEDPSSAHLTAVVDDDLVARISYDDIDIAVTFGDAEENAAAAAWMADPVYPEARTDWNETDEFIFNSVFLPGYGLEAVPFPSFASYALTVDGDHFVTDDAVRIRDPHAEEADLEEYAAALLADGFLEVQERAEDGTEQTVFRKLLREPYQCYSSISLTYDDGFNLAAEKYYDVPEYESLEEINAQTAPYGYPELPASEVFSAFHAEDRASEMAESWLYFFHYDLGLYADADFTDPGEAERALDAYVTSLENAGFHAVLAGDGGETDHYESEDGLRTFWYQFDESDTLHLLYKVENSLSAGEAEERIREAGFPEIDLSDPITCRDLAEYQKVQYGREVKAYLTVTQSFGDAQEAEAFLSACEEKLTEAGFGRVNPENAGSNKQVALWNEEEGLLVGIDFFEEEADVYFDFSAE